MKQPTCPGCNAPMHVLGDGVETWVLAKKSRRTGDLAGIGHPLKAYYCVNCGRIQLYSKAIVTNVPSR